MLELARSIRVTKLYFNRLQVVMAPSGNPSTCVAVFVIYSRAAIMNVMQSTEIHFSTGPRCARSWVGPFPSPLVSFEFIDGPFWLWPIGTSAFQIRCSPSPTTALRQTSVAERPIALPPVRPRSVFCDHSRRISPIRPRVHSERRRNHVRTNSQAISRSCGTMVTGRSAHGFAQVAVR
jgi:hypothetical protein